MTAISHRRMALPTGVELDVWTGGDPTAPAMVFLHGFPESHRTWAHQMADFAQDHFVVAPDQRGFARSGKPADVADYAHEWPIADVLALADALGIGRFTLVGHDWGGAISWGVALGHADRVAGLVIINAPHPFVFQKSIFHDANQRAASQYIRMFRTAGIEDYISGDLNGFFDKTFVRHFDLPSITPEHRAAYIDEWSQPGAVTAMLNWYRAAPIIVPALDEVAAPPAYFDAPFPPVTVPTLVVWGMQDKALTPSQLDGLDDLVTDLTVLKVDDAGHFITWEKPEAVTGAIRAWLTPR